MQGFLYNSEVEVVELPFDEKRLSTGQIVSVHDESIFGHNVVIAKIEKIPYGMCDAWDKSQLN